MLSTQPNIDEKTLRQRICFEEMLSDISARFMAAPFDRIDSEVENALRRTMEFFRVDRCALLEVQENRELCRITHAVYRKGVGQVSGEINLAELYPWSYDKLIHGEIINISSVEDYPEDALRDRQTHVETGNKSVLDIPLAFGGQISSIIVINSTRGHQVWPEEYIPRLRLLGEILANALERRKDRVQLQEQLGFEMLLADIFGRFVNLPPDMVDSEIEEAQRRVCQFLGLDLSVLWLWSTEPPRALKLVHVYSRPDFPPIPDPMYAHEHFPWCQGEMDAGRIIKVSSRKDLPAEAAGDVPELDQFGLKSMLIFPLKMGAGPPTGALSFNTTRHERAWPVVLVQRLQLVARIFTGALIHKKAEMALRESEQRLSLATEAVGAGLWIMEIGTGKIWASAKCRELFGFSPAEKTRYERFFATIHPEDRERVHEEVQRAILSGESLNCDYRIELPDGRVRWVVSRGQLFVKSDLEPDRFVGISLEITERKQMESQLQERLKEIEGLKERLESENVYLREEKRQRFGNEEIVGDGPAVRGVLAKAGKVACTESTVLIMGETGTGKELLARAIHNMSGRKDRTLVTVNCSSLPPALVESELFGREKGAYTGALTRMAGRFEIADGSTLFLDEIGELPLELQSKLLRVLEYGVFERLGSTRTVKVNVRIIAATNRDLSQDVAAGKFRKDLYYRLNVFPIVIPPLRERREDVSALVWTFVRQFESFMGTHVERISKRSMEALEAYPWPGNIRELRNVVEHAMIMSPSATLDIKPPVLDRQEMPECFGTLEDMERRHITEVLEKTSWRISGPNGAAQILGMKRTTLQSKMKLLGIAREVTQ